MRPEEEVSTNPGVSVTVVPCPRDHDARLSHRATAVTAATRGLPLGLRESLTETQRGRKRIQDPGGWLEMFPFAEECFAQALARIT